MRDRRSAEITIILTIGIVLIALILYFSPQNPYCFGFSSFGRRTAQEFQECVNGGPLEGSSPARPGGAQ
jgi:hypothetical protein